MDRTQLDAEFDVFMARKTYLSIMGRGKKFKSKLLNRTSNTRKDLFISDMKLINGWDLFEACVSDTVGSFDIPQSEIVAQRITDEIAHEIDIIGEVPPSINPLVREIIHYIGVEVKDGGTTDSLADALCDLIKLWGKHVPTQ